MSYHVDSLDCINSAEAQRLAMARICSRLHISASTTCQSKKRMSALGSSGGDPELV